MNDATLNFFFVYFRPFLITIAILQIEKSVDGVLRIQTRGRRMAGTDDTMELWWPKPNFIDTRLLLHQTGLRSIPEYGGSRFILHHQHHRSHPALSSPVVQMMPQQPQITQNPLHRSQAQHLDKYLSCHGAFWHGRSMLERVILTLLVVSVFLVGGLVLVQLGTGHLMSGNFALTGKPGKSFVSDNSNNGDDSSDNGKLFRDDGVEIVRIKTTEEVS